MIRFTRLIALGAAVSAFTACADPATQQKVADLEKKVEELEKKIAEAPAGGAAAAPANDEAAMALYREANEAFRGGDTDTAKEKLDKLMKEHQGSRFAQAGARLLQQLEVVGKEISDIKVEEWYQGETSLADGDATLLVFWEVWCPHCKREVPKLQETYTKFKGEGLNVIGLTKLTRGKTKDDVTAFMSENSVGYPVAKEAGDMSEFFGVSGVPAAAVVKDGKVVWRGHPAQLNDDMIKGWIEG